MRDAIKKIIDDYNPKNKEEAKYALREIVQYMVLIGLSKAGFFKKGSFYGGTALRTLYGLNRYSEDLDFTLNTKESDFSIINYMPSIEEVAKSYGLNIEVTAKTKTINTPIESAFAKLNTYEALITLKKSSEIIREIHKDEKLKIKFEVDTEPALGFITETKWIDLPEFAPIVVLDLPSLFAGKIHAIISRNYKNNVKGRDYYDFLFFIKKKVKPNLKYLREKLIGSKVICETEDFDIDVAKKILKERIAVTDFDQVRYDIKRFLIEQEDLSFYSKELFLAMIERL